MQVGNYSRQTRQLALPQLYTDVDRHAVKAYVLAMPHQYGHHKNRRGVKVQQIVLAGQ